MGGASGRSDYDSALAAHSAWKVQSSPTTLYDSLGAKDSMANAESSGYREQAPGLAETLSSSPNYKTVEVAVDPSQLLEGSASISELPYDSLGDSYMTPTPELNTPKKGRGGAAKAIVVLILVALLGVGGYFVWNNFFNKSAPVEETVGTTRVVIGVDAQYYFKNLQDPDSAEYNEADGSRLPIRIVGETKSGETVDDIYYIPVTGFSATASVIIKLEDGDYTYEALGSPIAANGYLYDFADVSGSFTVPVNLEKGYEFFNETPSGPPSPSDLIAYPGFIYGSSTYQQNTPAETYDEDDISVDIDETSVVFVIDRIELKAIDPTQITDKMIEEAVAWAKKDAKCADIAAELGQAARFLRAQRQVDVETLYDAYEDILDNAASYFGTYREMEPDGNYSYYLTDVTGDYVPELFLLGHYRADDSSTAGWRILPFVYDAAANDIVVATSSYGTWDMCVFKDDWMVNDWHADKANNSIVYEAMSGGKALYYRLWIEGTQINFETIESDEYYAGGDAASIDQRALSVDDRRYLEHMRQYDSDWLPEYSYETEWFYIDFGDASWNDGWSAYKISDNAWRVDEAWKDEQSFDLDGTSSLFWQDLGCFKVQVCFGDEQPSGELGNSLLGMTYDQNGAEVSVYLEDQIGAAWEEDDCPIHVK